MSETNYIMYLYFPTAKFNIITVDTPTMLADVINIIFWFAALVVMSHLLDRMYSYALPRWIYLFFAAPGIIVHEGSHWAACKITGARVTSVTLISRVGGEVVHGKPRGGALGQTLISMAPFLGIPLLIVLIGLLFDLLLGCDISWNYTASGSMGEVFLSTLGAAWDLIYRNLWELRAFWFVFYLYLATSFTLSLAPSGQDFKNSYIGLIMILGGTMIFTIAIERLFPDWGLPVISFLVEGLGWIVVIGLVMCLFGLMLGSPFLLVKYMRNR